jgi:hypothetical protein
MAAGSASGCSRKAAIAGRSSAIEVSTTTSWWRLPIAEATTRAWLRSS